MAQIMIALVSGDSEDNETGQPRIMGRKLVDVASIDDGELALKVMAHMAEQYIPTLTYAGYLTGGVKATK